MCCLECSYFHDFWYIISLYKFFKVTKGNISNSKSHFIFICAFYCFSGIWCHIANSWHESFKFIIYSSLVWVCKYSFYIPKIMFMEEFYEFRKVFIILFYNCIVYTDPIKSEFSEVLYSLHELGMGSLMYNELIVKLWDMRVNRKNYMIHDMHIKNFFAKFFIRKFDTICHKHDSIKSDFFRECKHHEKIMSYGDFSSDDFEIVCSIFLCLEYIFKYFFCTCVYLSFIEVDTKYTLCIACISSKDDGFFNEHSLFF